MRKLCFIVKNKQLKCLSNIKHVVLLRCIEIVICTVNGPHFTYKLIYYENLIIRFENIYQLKKIKV